MSVWSKTWTWIDGQWLEGNPPVMGPRTHAAWQGTSVFDGARYFDGVMPDLDLHCARANDSARALAMNPTMEVGKMVELVQEGIKKFEPDEKIYIKPMYWAEYDGSAVINCDPDSTRFMMCLFEAPMAPEGTTTTATSTSFRRPTMECMPVNAKAGCLYPNNARTVVEAKSKGFDTAVVCDMIGNVAELSASNIFMVKDGVVHTPVPNGTFLNGLTRQRTIKLLRQAGYTVMERTISYAELLQADELFSTGNYNKVVPVSRIDDHEPGIGPISQKARELYFEFAFSNS
ncbi:MAG: branched-chain amino acid aminotransferase [Rhodobacteraceae bacterium]|nr:branched-chain amino acid aminotransferase [Paracoccaceae bacterium]